MSIISLLNQIKEEDIVLPAIQRGFVWPEDKVEMLLDSIMKPIFDAVWNAFGLPRSYNYTDNGTWNIRSI